MSSPQKPNILVIENDHPTLKQLHDTLIESSHVLTDYFDQAITILVNNPNISIVLLTAHQINRVTDEDLEKIRVHNPSCRFWIIPPRQPNDTARLTDRSKPFWVDILQRPLSREEIANLK